MEYTCNNGINAYLDDYKNVIIKIPANCEGKKPLLLSAHMDVVGNSDPINICYSEDGKIIIKGLAQPKDFKACEVARIKVHGKCNCEEPHEVESEVVIKVEDAKMFFKDCPIVDVYDPDDLETQGLDYIIAGMDMPIEPMPRMPIDEDDEEPGAFLGWWILFAPEDANLEFEAWDAVGANFTIEQPGCIVVHGVNYKVQWLDLTSGKIGIEVEVHNA